MRGAPLAAAAVLLVAARPAPTGLMLNGHNLDPALVLPPPPADGGPVAREELEQLHRIEASRTPDEVTRARTDDAVKDVSIFRSAMGPAFDLARLPATAELFTIVRAEEKAAADRAKAYFQRPRPWIVDAGLKPCSEDDDPRSSYPSGHTTIGYAMGAVLARLAPSRAPAIMARAAAYARARLVCEVHFPSDVAAGQAYGMLVAERLMEQPAFRARYRAAAAELRRAGIAG